MTLSAQEHNFSVSDLSNFPFPSFAEFREKCLSGVASLGVDRGVAVQWAMNGIFSPTTVRVKVTLLSWVPFLIVIAFITYVFFSLSWWWHLSLPVFVVWYFFSNPSMAFMLGIIHKGILTLVWGGLVWGLLNGTLGLAAFAAALLAMRYAMTATYKVAVGGILQVASEKEELLCKLWNGNAVNVNLYNGDTYCLKYSTVAGNSKWYE